MPLIRSVIALLCCTASVCAQHEVRTVSNEKFKGTIVALDQKEIHLRDANGSVKKLPLSKVLAVDLRAAKEPPATTKYALVQLTDDSKFLCKKAELVGDKAKLELLSGPKITLPRKILVGLLRGAENAKLRAQFHKFVAETTRRDRILRLVGGELNPLTGALGELSADGKTIQFKLDLTGGITNIKLANLQGLIWYRIPTAGKSPICLVYDTTGNNVAAMSVLLKDGKFVVTTGTGNKIEFTEAALAQLDFNRGKLTYLSDLTPVAQSAVSTIKVPESFMATKLYRRNKSLEGQQIVLGNKKYAKGLAMHAHCELEYDLGGKYKTFKAELGVDARAPFESKAIVLIRCDGVTVYRKQVKLGKIIDINLNVRNVKRMRIVVTNPDDDLERLLLNLYDRATIAKARIIQ